MNKLTFKSKGFYQPVIDRLESYGLKFMAWVTVNNKMVPFHVPALAAQDSRLFFQLPGKSMILMLGYLEQYFSEELPSATEEGLRYRGYWHGEVWISYDNIEMRFDLLDQARKEKGHDNVDYSDIEIPSIRTYLNGGINFLAFCGSGCGCTFEEDCNEFDIFEAIKAFSWIIKEYGPYMEKRFDELNVTGFAPYYAFPNCEKLFWNNFPHKRLRSKVAGDIFGNK